MNYVVFVVKNEPVDDSIAVFDKKVSVCGFYEDFQEALRSFVKALSLYKQTFQGSYSVKTDNLDGYPGEIHLRNLTDCNY